MSERIAIPDVAPRFAAYHRSNPAWGCLHIVLDDGNVQDDHVRHCIEWARASGDAEGEALAEILLRMSKTQRKKLPHCLDADPSPARLPGDAHG